MSKVIVCAVFDSGVRSYGRPFTFKARGEALRSWETIVNSKDSPFNAHPHDFCLFEIGSFDEDTAEYVPLIPHFSFGVASNFLRAPDGSRLSSMGS
jgi:hypothetical protein